MKQAVPRTAHPAQKQSARYMAAEGATAAEAEMVMADNAQLRARIAELEGTRRDRGARVGMTGVLGAAGDKNGHIKN